MSALNNKLLKDILLVFSVGCIVLISACICVLVKLEYCRTNALAIGFFFVLGQECLLYFTLGMHGCMVPIYVESKKILGKLKKEKVILNDGLSTRSQHLEVKASQKFYESCSPVRIKLGENNFLEEKTPLRCIDFAMGLTINFLLLIG